MPDKGAWCRQCMAWLIGRSARCIWSNALIPDIWPEIQGLLQENGEMEVFPAIIPLYCTVFGGVLQRGMALKFWELYLGTYRGTLSGNCFRGVLQKGMALVFWELYLGTYRGILSGNCFRGSIAERDGSDVLGAVTGDVSGDLSGDSFREQLSGSIAERDGSEVLGVVSGDVSGGLFQGTAFGGVLQKDRSLLFGELFRCRVKVRGA